MTIGRPLRDYLRINEYAGRSRTYFGAKAKRRALLQSFAYRMGIITVGQPKRHGWCDYRVEQTYTVFASHAFWCGDNELWIDSETKEIQSQLSADNFLEFLRSDSIHWEIYESRMGMLRTWQRHFPDDPILMDVVTAGDLDTLGRELRNGRYYRI